MTTQHHSLPAQTADQYSILDNIIAQTRQPQTVAQQGAAEVRELCKRY